MFCLIPAGHARVAMIPPPSHNTGKAHLFEVTAALKNLRNPCLVSQVEKARPGALAAGGGHTRTRPPGWERHVGSRPQLKGRRTDSRSHRLFARHVVLFCYWSDDPLLCDYICDGSIAHVHSSLHVTITLIKAASKAAQLVFLNYVRSVYQFQS